AYQQFVVDVNTRRNQLDQSKAGSDRDVSRYQLDLDIRKAELEAAKDNLRILREGASNRSKEVSNVITSTMSGMILDVPLEEGGFVIESNAFNEGSTIASVADMGELLFEGKVAEAEVGKLKEGMPLVITIGAIEERSFDGTLNFIAPKGKDEEGSIQFEVEASIKVPEDIFIRAGYSANADIILAKKEKVWAINERDLLFSNDST
ncbi:MAG: efflux RND transporter periplasmic adaptor subunit, partial [Chitinophagales bacterium]